MWTGRTHVHRAVDWWAWSCLSVDMWTWGCLLWELGHSVCVAVWPEEEWWKGVPLNRSEFLFVFYLGGLWLVNVFETGI